MARRCCSCTPEASRHCLRTSTRTSFNRKERDKSLSSCELFQILISRLFNYLPALVTATAICGQALVAASPSSASTLGAQDKILLVSFTNSTKDGDFDDSLKEAVRTALEESPFLNIIPEATLYGTSLLQPRHGRLS